MTDLKITTKGFIEAQKKYSKNITPFISKAVFQTTNLVETLAKKNFDSKFNRITGQGIQSIQTHSLGPAKARVFTSKKYLPILERGHKGIQPKRKKWLFIPLSIKAKRQGYQSGMVFGEDFVLTKKVKPMEGRPFFAPAVATGRKSAQAFLSQQIKKAFN